MNSPELPGLQAGSLDSPNEMAEQALQRYFRKETPQPWPALDAPRASRNISSKNAWSSNRSRWILAAAAILLFLGPWLLSNKFTPAPKPGAPSVIDVGQKSKLAPAPAPPR